MKKTIALLLAILMLLPLVVSCSQNDEEDTSDAVTMEDDGLQMSDKIRGLSFDGEDINIWQTTKASNAAEYYYDMNGSVENGDFISLKLYERNSTVKDYLNINLNFVDTGSESKNAAEDIRPLLQAGAEEFDAYQLVQHNGIALVIEGWFKNLDDAKYLDFEGKWWMKSYMDTAKINGHNYIMAGDIGIDMISCAGAIFVNKDMLARYYGDEAYENLRTMVLEGTWTIDELTKLAKDMYFDLNNNKTEDIEDQYGFLSVQQSIDGFYRGAGGTWVERDSNGVAVLSIGSEHSIDIMARLYQMMHVESPRNFGNNAGTTQLYNNLHSPTIVQKFANGEMLFHTAYLYTARNFTNMTDEFAPLPYPKYNTDQQEYYSIIHNSAAIYAIPNTCSKYDQTGAVFEAMASLGNQIIIPFYYEQVLKLRYLYDVGDTELVDLIYDARVTDVAVIFDSTAFKITRSMIQDKRDNLSWYLATQGAAVQKELKAINKIKF